MKERDHHDLFVWEKIFLENPDDDIDRFQGFGPSAMLSSLKSSSSSRYNEVNKKEVSRKYFRTLKVRKAIL